MITEKNLDGYETFFVNEEEFQNELNEMIDNDEWYTGIPSESIQLEAILPVEAESIISKYGFDPDLAYDTAEAEGTQLVLTSYGRGSLVRQCAKESLCQTAKLNGTALARMSVAAYSDTLNNGFHVATGNSMMLMRYGKLASLHSDGDAGYVIMPMDCLFSETMKTARDKFGEVVFSEGYNSHSYTQAYMLLPEAQNKLMEKYQLALEEIGAATQYPINFMPALRFASSDTSNACATLEPLFQVAHHRYIKLCEGVKVKHSKKVRVNDKYGLELYKEQIQDIFAKFDDAVATIQRLASITILHPENCVIRLCREFNIPAKFGEAARQEIVDVTDGGASNAHDVYMAMTAVFAEAEIKKASSFVINSLEESVARIAKIQDWSSYDIGGTVAWKD